MVKPTLPAPRRAARLLVVLAAASLVDAGACRAQAGSPVGDAPPPPAAADCSRWPASVLDSASGACRCPEGMWWNLRGDACLPKEHAAAELCAGAWPASHPFFAADGSWRCACPPSLLWSPEAGACAPPPAVGAEECGREWPGTVPVLAPSGEAFECRCPGGRRWDERGRACVDTAPVVLRSPGGFFPAGSGAGDVAPAGAGAWSPSPPTPTAGAAAEASRGPLAGPMGGSPDSPPPSAGDAVPSASPPPPASTAGEACEALLSEIRGRSAAGQKAEADALGMRAAVRGCDPAAISEAVRGARP